MTWQPESPLRPPPGIDLIDAICISADQRERAQAQAPDTTQQMLRAMTMMMQMQAQMMQALTALVMRGDEKGPKDGLRT